MKYPGQVSLTKLMKLVKGKFDSLAKVASTGDFKDLINKPSFGITRSKVTVASDATVTLSIPITITNSNNLLVYQNGVLIEPTENYTISSDLKSINLVSYSASAGDIFSFIYIG